MEGFELLAQTPGFDGSQAMVRVMQHVHLRAKLFSQSREKLRRKPQVVFSRPAVLRRSILLCWLITKPGLRTTYAVGAAQPRNSRLRAHCLIAEAKKMAERPDRLLDVRAAGVSIDQNRLARGA